MNKGQLLLFHVGLPSTIDLDDDTYEEFVVACYNEDDARWIHPGSGNTKGNWDDYEKRGLSGWIEEVQVPELIVKCIGIADMNVVKEFEIIVASYHAG